MKNIFVELDRCLACRNCEQVCSFQEAGGFKRENSNIWVQIDLEKRSIFTMTCQQCETALCLEVCPTEGLIRDPKTNAVVVDDAACVGCKMCVVACPFGNIQGALGEAAPPGAVREHCPSPEKSRSDFWSSCAAACPLTETRTRSNCAGPAQMHLDANYQEFPEV